MVAGFSIPGGNMVRRQRELEGSLRSAGESKTGSSGPLFRSGTRATSSPVWASTQRRRSGPPTLRSR